MRAAFVKLWGRLRSCALHRATQREKSDTRMGTALPDCVQAAFRGKDVLMCIVLSLPVSPGKQFLQKVKTGFSVSLLRESNACLCKMGISSV